MALYGSSTVIGLKLILAIKLTNHHNSLIIIVIFMKIQNVISTSLKF